MTQRREFVVIYLRADVQHAKRIKLRSHPPDSEGTLVSLQGDKRRDGPQRDAVGTAAEEEVGQHEGQVQGQSCQSLGNEQSGEPYSELLHQVKGTFRHYLLKKTALQLSPK